MADRELYLKKITQSLLNLPTLPTIHAKLLEVVDNPRTTAAILAELISEDQVLTAKLLKMCNSAYYGLKHDVNSVQHAIALLGFEQVREIGLGVSVLQQLGGVSSGFNLDQLWEHSGVVGVIARSLAKSHCPQDAGMAFLGGLLHDLGKVIMAQYLPEYSEVIQQAKEEEKPLFVVEQDVFGVHHGKVGSWLAKRWKLPALVSTIMEYHHNPNSSEEDHEILACVIMANVLSNRMLKGFSGNESLELSTEITSFLSLQGWDASEESLCQLEQEYLPEVEKSISMMKSLLQA